MTLTEDEQKELEVLSEIDVDYMCAGSLMSHAVSNLQRSYEHLKGTDDDSAHEIQKMMNRIENLKDENKKKRDNIRTRIEELWRRFDD